MRTKIIVIGVEEINSRKICEGIENIIVNNEQELIEKIRDIDSDFDTGYLSIWDLTDFMDEVNDMNFYFDDSFMSYVNFKTD